MKKVLTIVLVIAMIVAMAIPALAKNAPVDKLTWTDGFGFHCNAAKGNGATDVINLINDKVVAKGSQKDVFGVKSNPIALKWDVETTYDLLTNNIECATCGRIDWVTYSNNNGVINGKNIQVYHSGSPRYWAQAYAKLVLIDIVKDCEGEIVSKDVETVNKSGKYTTDEKAIFNFDIPEGFDIIKGKNPIIVEFAAIRGQNIDGGKVVAVRITVLPCDCPIIPPDDGEDDPKPPKNPPCGHVNGAVCDECKEGNGNNCSNCVNVDQPNSNTNFFCIDCGEKVGQKNPSNLTNPNVTWGVQECSCPKCCPHD